MRSPTKALCDASRTGDVLALRDPCELAAVHRERTHLRRIGARVVVLYVSGAFERGSEWLARGVEPGFAALVACEARR